MIEFFGVIKPVLSSPAIECRLCGDTNFSEKLSVPYHNGCVNPSHLIDRRHQLASAQRAMVWKASIIRVVTLAVCTNA